jgi:ubiquinone/menaquinone biosynthesis C-methylase UbiE
VDTASFIRYLAAKKTVDDRSLNRNVWDRMIGTFHGLHPRVLELGGGIGAMIERVAAEGRLHPSVWTMIDAQPALIDEARRRIPAAAGFGIELRAAELAEYLESGFTPADLVVASAFLDLFDLSAALRSIARLGAPEARFLFSITFDGLTALEPEIDPALDRLIVEIYHRTMDERIIDGAASGDSRCGRHLLTLLPRCGYRIEEAGPSDWIVHPREGSYPADEAYFLSCILGFIEESLSPRPEMDQGKLRAWLGARRTQVAAGELVFLAHQLDVLATLDRSTPRAPRK